MLFKRDVVYYHRIIYFSQSSRKKAAMLSNPRLDSIARSFASRVNLKAVFIRLKIRINIE